MSFTLRPYQKKAVKKMMWAIDLPGNDILSLPQGSGKTHVIAEFAARFNKPILILVPSKELLEQDLEKLNAVIPKENIGVYSASMNSKEVKKYTLATIQSAYRHPEKFTHYEMAIIDECDLLNPKKLTSMYMKFFNDIGIKKVFGLSGTVFRQDVYYKYPPGYRGLAWQKAQIEAITTTKMINRYRGGFWSRMLYVINTQNLIDDGYLCPIEYHDMSLMNHKSIPTNKSKSNFDLEQFSSMVNHKHLELAGVIKNLKHKAKIVFCSSVDQANSLQKLTPNSAVITSETARKKRDKTVKSLKDGNLEILYNVGIFTVGFDYPELEAVILLRPTRSLRLHSQMIGRVTRIAEGKDKGHVYDFAGNIKSLGKLEDIKVKKTQATYRGKKYMTWNVVSPAMPNGFHGEALYKYKLGRRKNENNSND